MPPVVTTHAATLCGIPQESLRVLHHLQDVLRRELLVVRKLKPCEVLTFHTCQHKEAQ